MSEEKQHDVKLEEVLIHSIAERLSTRRHVAVGAASPIPAAAALLAQIHNPDLTVSILGSEKHSPFTDGGKELFDCAAQGRIDTFFLSGVQIDRQANINLVGTGHYPSLDRRFAGSFGSAYLYHIVRNVILFCWNHKTSVLVNNVDFISANGPDDSTSRRTGGPEILLTNRCIFTYNHDQRSFLLTHLHPGESIASVKENTGFDVLYENDPAPTQGPPADTLELMRGQLSSMMTDVYPDFASKLWSS